MKRTASLSLMLAAWCGAFLVCPARTMPNRTPRQAAQEGIAWLQQNAIAWQQSHRCYGCHAQAQVIMGLAVAKRDQYVISDQSLSELVQFVIEQNHDGTFGGITAT